MVAPLVTQGLRKTDIAHEYSPVVALYRISSSDFILRFFNNLISSFSVELLVLCEGATCLIHLMYEVLLLGEDAHKSVSTTGSENVCLLSAECKILAPVVIKDPIWIQSFSLKGHQCGKINERQLYSRNP